MSAAKKGGRGPRSAIDAFAPDQKVRKNSSAGIRRTDRVFTLILFAMIVLSLLVVMAMGTGIYTALVDARSGAGSLRVETSLLSNNVRGADEIDAVGTGEGPEGPALVLTEHLASGDYEIRFYLYQGSIVEEYAVAGDVYSPGRGTQVAQSQAFSFDYDADSGLITVQTDTGTSYIATRSREDIVGGAQS